MTSSEQMARPHEQDLGRSQTRGDGPIPYMSGLSLVSHSTGRHANAFTKETDVSIPTLAPESPILMGADISEHDIELEVLALPTVGRYSTYSTDRLIPPSSSSTSLKDYRPSSAHGPITESKPPLASQKDTPIPNYKPPPLRWPFASFLFALIAGLFAFLEYEVRNLPSNNYSVLESFHPWHKLSPLPVPEPRPPEQIYPKPFAPYNTYCGWRAPVWFLWSGTWVPRSCTTQVDECEVIVEGDVREQILTFTTDDSSWCPCMILEDWYRGDSQRVWGMGVGMSDKVWNTTDHGCKSVMMAIESFNGYKAYYGYSTVPTRLATSIQTLNTDEDVEGVWLSTQELSVTTPPERFGLQSGNMWDYPSTDANGNIWMPMVTRTAGVQTKDVFGNMVRPTDSALFPDHYQGQFTPRTTGSLIGSPEPNKCYWNPDCPQTSYSTVWWILPLSKPAISSSAPIPSAMTTMSLASTSLDSTPRAGSTSLVWHPSPTSGGTDSARESMAASTRKSAPLQTWPPQISSTTVLLGLESTLASSSITIESISSTTTLLGLKSTLGSFSTAIESISKITISTVISSHSTKGSDTPSDIKTESPHSHSVTSHGGNSLLHNGDIMSATAHISNNKTSIPSPAATSMAYLPPLVPGHHPPPKGPISPNAQSSLVNLRSEADYLMVTVVPTLLATLLLVLLQVLTASINSLLPFRALRQPQGASPNNSLCLSRNQSALSSPSIAFRFLYQFKDPLPLLVTVVSGLATILVSFSSEVIRLDIATDCRSGNPDDGGGFNPVRACAYGLRKSGTLMRIAEGILVTLAILVIVITAILARWKSGLSSDPWSIASMASMLKVNGELQTLLRNIPASSTDGRRDIHVGTHIRQTLEGRRFRLGFSHEPEDDRINHAASYRIKVVPTFIDDNTPIKTTSRDLPTRKSQPQKKQSTWRISSTTRELTVRTTALLFTTGLLILILHYETTVGVNTPFESFMNSQTIGVRILFAAFGTTINAFWDYYFSYTSEFQTHHLLSKTPQPANSSILLSPPSNIFLGLWRSIHITTTQDLLSFNIALATFLAKFTPIVLSNIPFSNAVTWKIHEACTWLSVAFLSHMVLVLTISLVLPVWRTSRFSKDRENGKGVSEFPVRTDTIAKHMYYLCESRMVKDFEGLSVVSYKERDRLVSEMGRWYRFGEITTGMGERRIGVDYVDSGTRGEDCRGKYTW